MGTCSCRLSRQWLPPIGIFIANLVATERLVADGHERRAHRGYIVIHNDATGESERPAATGRRKYLTPKKRKF